ncbi:foldase PrsA [Streptococcus sp. zg-JUN1979]|uniref:foldase PrsA n=1 Tax=Streptococcus sp. zg-JUN1979 TaxID=3391450 RepID=UPI0039A4E216
MTKRRKFAAGLVTILSVATLAACSSTSKDSSVITMKGDTITIGEVYDQVKNNTVTQQAVLTLTLQRVLQSQYGDKVTDKEVSEAYNKAAEQYGTYFSAILAQQGMTAETYKQQIRVQMLVEAAVKEAAEKELTTDNYKKAFESYVPDTKIEVIKLDSEDSANATLSEVKAEGADFAAIAKDKTTETDKKSEYTVNSSTSTSTLPSAVLSAALSQDAGATSDVITVTGTTSSSYYIVKVVSREDKSDNWKDYKKQLKAIILNQKETDQNFQNQVLSEVLKKANVKVKDAAFNSIMSAYINNSSVSSSASTDASSSESEASSSNSEESTSTSEETANSDENASTEAQESETQESQAQ